MENPKILVIHKDEEPAWKKATDKEIKRIWARMLSVGLSRLTEAERTTLHRLPVKLRETFSWFEPDLKDFANCLLNARDIRQDQLVSVTHHGKGYTAIAPWKIQPKV